MSEENWEKPSRACPEWKAPRSVTGVRAQHCLIWGTASCLTSPCGLFHGEIR